MNTNCYIFEKNKETLDIQKLATTPELKEGVHYLLL